MKSVYERTQLNITEFDREDVITTSAVTPVTPDPTEIITAQEKENRYGAFSTFDLKPPTNNSWF
ncbi:MAG: hypothetical protein IJI19_02450 [Ruminococcus sp.]|nr:hypothetical protein [Ruminococcus sp.]